MSRRIKIELGILIVVFIFGWLWFFGNEICGRVSNETLCELLPLCAVNGKKTLYGRSLPPGEYLCVLVGEENPFVTTPP